MNEFYNLYPARETQVPNPWVYSPVVDDVYSVRRWQSSKEGNYSTSRRVRTWRILPQVITRDICCFSQRALHGIHSPGSHRSMVRWGGHIRCPCSYCVSSRSGICFNPSAGAITDHSQSTKDIDAYLKFQLYVEDPSHRKLVLILPNRLSKTGERADDRNKFLPWMEFEPTNSWSTVQCLTTRSIPLYVRCLRNFFLHQMHNTNIFDRKNEGQGHGVHQSHWSHSMANINLHKNHTWVFFALTVFQIFTFRISWPWKKRCVKIMMCNIWSGAIRWQIPDFLSDDNSNVCILQQILIKIANSKILSWKLKSRPLTTAFAVVSFVGDY